MPALAILTALLFWKLPYQFGALVGYVFVATSVVFAGAICAVLAAFYIQALLLLAILCVNVVRFGIGPPLQHTALIRVTSEATPAGAWEVETFPSTGFAHGEIHEDAQVADRIVRWLTEVERREPRESDA
jgi:hypothetical protein